MSTDTETRPADTDPPPGPLVPRPALFGLLLVVVLVVAVAAGSWVSSGPATPDADSVDVGFAQDMSVHHRQAVEMATWERDHTADPALRQLAYDIESTQNQQIGRMQGWLGLWNMPSLPIGGHMAWMAGDGHTMSGMGAGVSRMPGMATSEDLRRMRTTPEPGLDVVFLQLMLRHHMGGSGMLEYAAAHADNTEVRNLATQMLTAQTSEADLMKRMLAARGAQPLPV